MKYYVMLLLSVLLTALVLVFFKIVSMDSKGDIIKMLGDIRLYVAVLIYGGAFLLWIISASKIDYTVLVFSNTGGLIISGLVGYFVFHETITLGKIISYVLIASGVITLVLTSART